MNPQDTIRVENYARHCGYSTKKEGGRYCQGIVNLLKDAWITAQQQAQPAPEAAVPDLGSWVKGEPSTHRQPATQH